MTFGWLAALAALAGVAGCRPWGGDASIPFGRPVTWIDLTYPFDSSTIYWPTAERFVLERVAAGRTPGGYYYAANNFRAAEHGGTHLDAPIHFAAGQHTAEQVPIDRLIGPAVVIDVTADAATNPD